jgi:hypothetical protein
MYSFVKARGKYVYATVYDKHTKTWELIKEKFKPYIFQKNKNGKYNGFILPQNKYNKIEFENEKECHDYTRMIGENQTAGDISNLMAHQFIRDKQLVKDIEPDVIKLWYLDIEVYSDAGFPYADVAEFPVTSISVIQEQHGKKKLFVWTTIKNVQPDFQIEDNEYYVFNIEQQMMTSFLMKMKAQLQL